MCTVLKREGIFIYKRKKTSMCVLTTIIILHPFLMYEHFGSGLLPCTLSILSYIQEIWSSKNILFI